MNGLSWFLYFAELLPKLATLSLTLGVVTLILWVLRAIFVEADEYPCQGVLTGSISTKYSMVGLAIALIFAATLIPSKETIYLIAGSQAGEAVVTSESGQEILNDIQEVIKHQLGELKGEKK